MPDDNQNNWSEYSKLVLKELETLGSGIGSLQNEQQALRDGVSRLQSNESKVDEIKEWKNKVNEVSSPTQMKELVKKVDDLNAFRIKATGIFIAVQFIMAIIAFAMKLTG